MKVNKTSFPGLLIFEPDVFQDQRGLFYESWRAQDYRLAGVQEEFLQDNISFSRQNVIRGLHFNRFQGQLVSILQGHVLDVAVDLRSSSPTFKQYFSLKLKEDHPQQIYMPPGFAHGFCVLSASALLHYKCTQYYDSQREEGVLWNDPELSISWPIKDPILSERDRALPLLKEIVFND